MRHTQRTLISPWTRSWVFVSAMVVTVVAIVVRIASPGCDIATEVAFEYSIVFSVFEATVILSFYSPLATITN